MKGLPAHSVGDEGIPICNFGAFPRAQSSGLDCHLPKHEVLLQAAVTARRKGQGDLSLD